MDNGETITHRASVPVPLDSTAHLGIDGFEMSRVVMGFSAWYLKKET